MKKYARLQPDLGRYQLTELTDEAKKEVNGGLFPTFAWWIASGVAAIGYTGKNVIDNWQCFKDGLRGRRHDRNNCGH